MDNKGTTPQLRPTTREIALLRVEVVEGSDRGQQITQADVIAVGTAAGNTLVTTDATISRFHMEASISPKGIAITDLGSTNGTHVGNVRIDLAIVAPGTLVKIGNTTLRVDDGGRSAVVEDGRVRDLVGMRSCAPQLHRLFAQIERIAPTSSSVLIVGESGTGKERAAEALHALSPRRDQPFVTIDCGSLSSSLLASELFGHEKGAFTGADRQHVGAFERAAGGTVFLDEIGELPPADQAAMLGVLERKRFRRVGGRAEIALEARVLAATNRDLRGAVNQGRFRNDLYHRLAVVVLRIPPLRERPMDVPVLVELLARQLGATGEIDQLFGVETITRWQQQSWPGNVRELRNAVEAALVIGVDTLDPAGSEINDDLGPPSFDPYRLARARVLDTFEREYLTRLMAAAGGNVTHAARLGSMDRTYLIDLLRRNKIAR